MTRSSSREPARRPVRACCPGAGSRPAPGGPACRAPRMVRKARSLGSSRTPRCPAHAHRGAGGCCAGRPTWSGPPGPPLPDADGLAAGDNGQHAAGRDAPRTRPWRRAAPGRAARRSPPPPRQHELVILDGRGGNRGTSQAGPFGRTRPTGTAISSAWTSSMLHP